MSGRRPSSRPRMLVVNLEDGRPGVDEAIRRLGMRLDTARMQGVKLVRVIHGYGSSGKGGSIREAVQRHLRERQRRGGLRGFVWGGDWPDSPAARALLERRPVLRDSLRTDTGNEGITFVEL
ncbi:MAG TPA: Smr/MutS family protein [Longimicrobiales bacterium]|nr:Smr/MutS family protein [Longimicrobiales bacterium]